MIARDTTDDLVLKILSKKSLIVHDILDSFKQERHYNQEKEYHDDDRPRPTDFSTLSEVDTSPSSTKKKPGKSVADFFKPAKEEKENKEWYNRPVPKNKKTNHFEE